MGEEAGRQENLNSHMVTSNTLSENKRQLGQAALLHMAWPELCSIFSPSSLYSRHGVSVLTLLPGNVGFVRALTCPTTPQTPFPDHLSHLSTYLSFSM